MWRRSAPGLADGCLGPLGGESLLLWSRRGASEPLKSGTRYRFLKHQYATAQKRSIYSNMSSLNWNQWAWVLGVSQECQRCGKLPPLQGEGMVRDLKEAGIWGGTAGYKTIKDLNQICFLIEDAQWFTCGFCINHSEWWLSPLNNQIPIVVT